MGKNSAQLSLDSKRENSRRTFFKQAGSLLRASSAASLGTPGVNAIAHAAGTISARMNTPTRSLGWSSWESLEGVLTSYPAVSSWASGRLDVFVRGTDNAMWHKWFDRKWSSWESLGGMLTSAPGAVSWGFLSLSWEAQPMKVCQKGDTIKWFCHCFLFSVIFLLAPVLDWQCQFKSLAILELDQIRQQCLNLH